MLTRQPGEKGRLRPRAEPHLKLHVFSATQGLAELASAGPTMLTAIPMYVTGSKLCVKVLVALFLATARTWRAVQWGVGRVGTRGAGAYLHSRFPSRTVSHSRDRRCGSALLSEAAPGHLRRAGCPRAHLGGRAPPGRPRACAQTLSGSTPASSDVF